VDQELVEKVARYMYRRGVQRDAWAEEETHVHIAFLGRVSVVLQALEDLDFVVIEKKALSALREKAARKQEPIGNDTGEGPSRRSRRSS